MTVHFVRRCGQLIVALSLLAFLMPSSIGATTRAAPSMTELLDNSDVIVAGVMPEHGDHAFTIEVSGYLRGNGPRRIETEILHAQSMGEFAFRFDQPGVFFLKRSGDTFAPAAWKAFLENRSYVETMIHIDRDPGPFLSSPRWRSNTDVIEMLGARFSSFKVTSTDAPDLAAFVARERIDPFPWSMKGRREITLTTQAESPYVTGDGTPAGDHLAAVLTHNPREWAWARARTPARFTLVFDTRRPTRWGSVGPGAALQIVDEYLRSRNSWLQHDVMWVATRMRAEEALPPVIALLKHEDREVASAAINTLRRSRSPLGTRALTEWLDRGAEPSTMEDLARALTCIAGETALPVFRVRAGHVENARYALGAFGTLDDIQTLMEDTPRMLQFGHAALVAARARTNAVSDTWHNAGLVDKKLEAKLWGEWWERNRATLKIVTPPTAQLSLNCYH